MKNKDFNFKQFVRNIGLARKRNKNKIILGNSIVSEAAISPTGRYANVGQKQAGLDLDEPPATGAYFVSKELKDAIVKDLQSAIKDLPVPKVISDNEAKKYAQGFYNAMVGDIEYYTSFLGIGLGTYEADVEALIDKIPTNLDLAKVAMFFERKYGHNWLSANDLLGVFIEEFGERDFETYVKEPIMTKSENSFIKLGKEALSFEEFEELTQGAGEKVEDIDVDGESGSSIRDQAQEIVKMANTEFKKARERTVGGFVDTVRTGVGTGGAITSTIGGISTLQQGISQLAKEPMKWDIFDSGKMKKWSKMKPAEKAIYKQWFKRLPVTAPAGTASQATIAASGLSPALLSSTPDVKVNVYDAALKTSQLQIQPRSVAGAAPRPPLRAPDPTRGLLGWFTGTGKPTEFMKVNPAYGVVDAGDVAGVKPTTGFSKKMVKTGRVNVSRIASLQALKNLGFGGAARTIGMGAVRGLTNPVSLVIFALTVGDVLFNAARTESVEDVAPSLSKDMFKAVMKAFKQMKRSSRELLAIIQATPVYDEEAAKERKAKKDAAEKSKKDRQSAEEDSRSQKAIRDMIAAAPLTGIKFNGKNLLAKIRHVMNKYGTTRSLGLTPLVTDDTSWGAQDIATWAAVCPHIMENHSIIKNNPTTKTILETIDFNETDSWKRISASYRFDYPGYTPNKTGMLSFLVDGYNDKVIYGKRARSVTDSKKKDDKTKSGGGVAPPVPPAQQSPDTRKERRGGGVGLRPRNVSIKVFGIPGIESLDEILSPGASIKLKRMLVDNIKSRRRGTIIEPSETLMMVIRVDAGGNLVNVRKAPGQLGDFNDFKVGTWRKYGPGVSRLHAFLQNRKFSNLGGVRQFELHFTFPAGFYDQS